MPEPSLNTGQVATNNLATGRVSGAKAGGGLDEEPFFHGVEPRFWTSNRYYRAFVTPSELIFIRAGSSGEISNALGMQFGLIGSLLSSATSPEKKNQKQQEQFDGSSLDELMQTHKHNYRISLDEISDATLDPMSATIAGIYSQPDHVGVFRFQHPERGKVRFALDSKNDMEKAMKLLPAVLGARLMVNVEWREDKNRFKRRSWAVCERPTHFFQTNPSRVTST